MSLLLLVAQCKAATNILISFATDIDNDLNITVTGTTSLNLDGAKDVSYPQPVETRFIVFDVASKSGDNFLMFNNIEIHGSPCTGK